MNITVRNMLPAKSLYIRVEIDYLIYSQHTVCE